MWEWAITCPECQKKDDPLEIERRNISRKAEYGAPPCPPVEELCNLTICKGKLLIIILKLHLAKGKNIEHIIMHITTKTEPYTYRI